MCIPESDLLDWNGCRHLKDFLFCELPQYILYNDTKKVNIQTYFLLRFCCKNSLNGTSASNGKKQGVNGSNSPFKAIDLYQQRNAKYFLPSRNVCKLDYRSLVS